MGIFHSKIAPVDQRSSSGSVDPRSPTININRSPISPIVAEPVPDKPTTITKVRDLTADLTEILDNAQTPDRAVGGDKLQSALDPRSPGVFLRTPLVLLDDSTDVSNISLRGSSIEYEEIDDSEGELSFKDCSMNVPNSPVTDSAGCSGSIFSDTSLHAELKADIDCIIQKLYDTGSKDPRSPSVAILRTPIVLQESTTEEESTSPIEVELQIVPKQDTEDDAPEEEKNTTTNKTIVLHDETAFTPTVDTPKLEKADLSARSKLSAIAKPRTPLGCVTNVQQPLGNGAGNDMLRKTALLGQMKQQGSAGLGNSAELKKVQMRSKIPTFRVK